MSASGSLEVLVLCASPVGDLATLKLPQELIKIEARLRKAQVPVRMTRVFPPTIKQLRHELTAMSQRGDQPGIFHFLGHGDDDGLYFEDELGASQLVKGSELKAALQESPVKLVLLNACWSATKRGVSLVEFLTRERVTETAIGHEVPVADVSAIQFAERFYELVVSGKTLKQACDQARNSLAESGLPGAADVKLVGDSELKLTSDLPVGQHAFVSDDGLPTIGYLPDASVFFGRQEQLLEIARALSDSNLVAVGVWGLGGIGKTALVLEAARRNAWRYRGTAWVDIREATQKTTVGLLGMALSRLSPGANSHDPQHALSQFLKGTPSLIVLDNLEDLPESELPALARFLKQMPRNGSHVLLTARVPLKSVEEVSDVTSIKLIGGLDGWHGPHYVQHVARQKKCLALQDELRHEHGELETMVTGLQGKCVLVSQRLHGHPKMLELAVGLAMQGEQWLNSALASLPEHLEDQLAPLLATSLKALGEDGRKLLPLLVFFPTGRLTPEALQVVAAIAFPAEPPDEQQITEDPLGDRTQSNAWFGHALHQLSQAGLLDYDQATNTYSFHQSLLDESDRHSPADQLRGEIVFGLLGHYAKYFVTNTDNYDAIERCLDNALLFMEVGWASNAKYSSLRVLLVQMADSLSNYLIHQGRWQCGEEWRTRAVELRNSFDVSQSENHLNNTLYQRAHLMRVQGRTHDARVSLHDVLRRSELTGDPDSVAAVSYELAALELGQGNLISARLYLERAISFLESKGGTYGLAASLNLLANLEHQEGNLVQAQQTLERVMRISESSNDEREQSAALYHMALVQSEQGKEVDARLSLQRSRAIAERLKDRLGLSSILHEIARHERNCGNASEARRLFIQSIQIKETLGELKGLSASLHELAMLEATVHNTADARRLWERSITIKKEIGDVAGVAISTAQLAQLEAIEGNGELALEMAREATRQLTALGYAQAEQARGVLQKVEEFLSNDVRRTGGRPELFLRLQQRIVHWQQLHMTARVAELSALAPNDLQTAVLTWLAHSVVCYCKHDIDDCEAAEAQAYALASSDAELAAFVATVKSKRLAADVSAVRESATH